MLVALVLASYATYKTGEDAHPGERLLSQGTGLKARAVREHLRRLRDDLRLIERVSCGGNVGRPNAADDYQLVIPDDAADRIGRAYALD